MRRVITIECDDAFFWMAQACLKSFLKFNSQWRELRVVDLGLTKAQRASFPKHTVFIEDEKMECGESRFPHSLARLREWTRFKDQPDTLVLHLDADVLTFGSFEPNVQAFLKSGCDFGMTKIMTKMYEQIRIKPLARQLFEKYDEWQHEQEYNDGVMLAIGDRLGRAAEDTIELKLKYDGLFSSGDQVPLLITLFEGDWTIFESPQVYNFPITRHQLGHSVLTEAPLTNRRDRAVIVHAPVKKYYLTKTDSFRYNEGFWWMKIAKRYEEEPWPIQELALSQ
jgi:lipopolysaccharide biosynthesis glycosyltransferase